MHYPTILASAFALGSLAMPYDNKLEDRSPAIITEHETVTVLVTVTVGRSQTAATIKTTSSSTSKPTTSTLKPTSLRSSSLQSTLKSSVASTRSSSSSKATTSPATTVVAQPTNAHITGTAQATLSAGIDYQNAILYHHNAARANHGAGPLTWCSDCEANARLAAETCVFAHYIPSGVKNGQNLFTTSGLYFNVTAGITESWYKSEFPPMVPYWGAADIPSDVFHSVGHLTQVLWKGTTGVGCVSIDCGSKMMVNGAASNLNKYTVCNYSPPGNYAGQYGVNVGSPKSSTNLGSWKD